MPLYNPEKDWNKELLRQYAELRNRLFNTFQSLSNIKLIIVNDGSTIDITEGMQHLKQSISECQWITYEENRGKGYALRKGVAASQSDIIIYTDYDFPYTYGSMVSMVQQMTDDKCDVVVGKRDASYYKHISARRRRISQYLRTVNKLLFNLPTDDTQCGLKAFKKSAKSIFMDTTTDRYLIDVDFLKKLSKKKIRVGVQLVKLRENVVLSKINNMRLIQELFSYLRIMIFG